MKSRFKNSLFLIFFLSCFFSSQYIFCQDVDIVPYLKQIENGNISEVKEALPDLKKQNPNSSSILFLDAVLTENGQEAVVKYQHIVDDYPSSKYADASLYRIYSYYYALGLYETANEKLTMLTTAYPKSPYIQIAGQNKIPVEKSTVDEKKDSEVVTIPKVETKNDTKYNFTAQAGAFTNLDNANTLKNSFESAGIFSEIRDKSVGGTTFHVVYAGKFITEKEAENFLGIINPRFSINGIVVPITWN